MSNMSSLVRTDESPAARLMLAPPLVRQRWQHFESLATKSVAMNRALNERLATIGKDSTRLETEHGLNRDEWRKFAKPFPKEMEEAYLREKAALAERKAAADTDARSMARFTQMEE